MHKFIFIIVSFTLSQQAFAASSSAGMESWLLGAMLIFATALIGRTVAEKFGQATVLGELLFGVLLGNALKAWPNLVDLHQFEIFAELGVIFLLFEVGLESDLRDLLSQGRAALAVAVLGVVAPFSLGYGASAFYFPGHSIFQHLFVGATLTATSVGITARVLQDLGKLQSAEAKIILGAAVIDDVLGLLTLAAVTNVITAQALGQSLSLTGLGLTVLKAGGFLVGALVVGVKVAPWFFRMGTKLKQPGAMLPIAVTLAFGFSYLAGLAGLAPMIGAFAAGLVIDGTGLESYGKQPLCEGVAALCKFFTPIFFVTMGCKLDLGSLSNPSALGFAAVLTVVAVLGKQAASLGVWRLPLRKAVVGIGMIPRGEVGLIFASIGLKLHVNGEPIMDAALFGAVVLMVLITTIMTPPLLKIGFAKHTRTSTN